jgi:hypothetical protein
MALTMALGVTLGGTGAQASGLPAIVGVGPSGPTLPENLLRLSLRFASAPEGPVLRRLALIGSDGQALIEPFLDQELWSPDGRLLTVLLHPGRVKTGLMAHDQLGGILAKDDVVSLTLDGKVLRRWQVLARDEEGPRPEAWHLSRVHEGRRDPLEVRLDAPVDAVEVGYFAVIDARDRQVPGHAELLDGETLWRFTPTRAWPARPLRLAVRHSLEDPAGNRLGGRFESVAGERPPPAMDTILPLKVCARTGPCR